MWKQILDGNRFNGTLKRIHGSVDMVFKLINHHYIFNSCFYQKIIKNFINYGFLRALLRFGIHNSYKKKSFGTFPPGGGDVKNHNESYQIPSKQYKFIAGLLKCCR